MIVKLTIEEKRSFSGKNQEEVTALWQAFGKKYAFKYETVKNDNGTLVAEPMIADDNPKQETEPDQSSKDFEPEMIEISVISAMRKMEAYVEKRDEVVSYLKSLKVTNHEQNGIARQAGGKAKTLISQINDIIKSQTEPLRISINNLNQVKSTLTGPIEEALREVAQGVKKFEDEIIKIQNDEKAEAEALKTKAFQEQRDKELKEQNLIKQVDVLMLDYRTHLKKPKKEVKELLKKLEAWKPDETKWSTAYKYLLSELENLKKEFQAVVNKEDLVIENKEPDFKIRFEEYLKILGIKEHEIDHRSKEYLQRFGSYELAQGNRHTIRDEINKETELKNQAAKTDVKIKNRRTNLVHRIVDEKIIPHEYFTLDEKKIKAAMKANKDAVELGEFTIPGVEFIEETKTVFRKS